jgi:gliding motility-associated-like protein
MAFNAYILQHKNYSLQIKQTIVLILLFIGFTVNSTFAVCNMLSPTLRCTDVQANGDVVLTWSLPPIIDPSFSSYYIYKASSLNGPYTAIDSIFSSAQTTYTDVGANADVSTAYYFVVSRCTGYQNAVAIDTLATMNLSVVNPGNGTALLSWNSPQTPTLPSAAATYTIYQEAPVNTWSVTGSKINNNAVAHNFTDTIFICSGNINYRVHITDNAGCTSVSSVSGGNFVNAILPSIPIIDTVSVDDNNITHLSWNQNPHPDVEGYIVYRFNGASWVALDTMLGISNTSFTHTVSTPSAASEQYRIAAYDTCGNISPQSGVRTTMFLKASADVCANSAILSWTAYPTIGTGLASYRIYQSNVSQAGPYSLVGSVPGGTLNYTATNLSPTTTYYFKITAVDNSGNKTASSNRLQFFSATPIAPAYLYLQRATVTSSSTIELVCYTDPSVPIINYKVYRAINDSIILTYEPIGEIAKSPSVSINYIDTNVDTDNNNYTYKVSVVDSCGLESMETNIGKTILLKATEESYVFRNHLTWNAYKGWPNGVAYYNIYRGTDGIMGTEPIAKILPNSTDTNKYTDNVSKILADKGEFSYFVEAVEAGGNIYGFTENSASNIVVVKQESLVYIPNAFAPEGLYNKVFKPVATYVDYSEYEFIVFNRIGNIVFRSTDVEQGWNGTMNGETCGVGVYVYVIKITTSKGKNKVYRGTVTLMK